MNDLTDQQLLRDYTGARSEISFAELVRRHVDLVYSAALRMGGDAQLAEDVTQGVFVALAEKARELTDHPVLSGWLHCTARNLSAKAIRADVRRRVREQEAAAMNELLSAESDATWDRVAPLLDAALGELSEPDRDALLFRYFEHKSAREMAQALGISDEAAQKRVSRAVDRLRESFAQRGVTIGAGGLVVVLSANAVQAAPVGLAATISTAVTLAGTAVSTSTLIATTKTIAMTTLQKALIATTLAVILGVGIYEARQNSKLRDQIQSLQQQQSPLAGQIQQLQHERDTATNRLALLAEELAAARKNPGEVLKLRGEVGALRKENKIAGEKSAISKITADPASRKLMRDQQKMGMTAIYADYSKRSNLTPELTEKFNDLLADSVMDNIDLITQVLHDGNSQAEVNRIFSDADTALLGKMQVLLGDDGLAKYKDYNQNLASTLITAQLAGQMTGDAAAKEDKRKQLLQVMQEETTAALKNAGLPADYQVVPILNFRNIASESQAEQSLKLLDGIFDRLAIRGSSFLSPEEIARFETFKTNALNGNRTALTMNRNLMAPLSK